MKKNKKQGRIAPSFLLNAASISALSYSEMTYLSLRFNTKIDTKTSNAWFIAALAQLVEQSPCKR